ncbi:hypothetical protein DH2020_035953 [Rehmannia glutinosa]|uniref:BHLH domain-containing protein n=1 Tax=Rehmannia glutinosa TaxID=99300 RepID=A0ABR0V6T4_REHGL
MGNRGKGQLAKQESEEDEIKRLFLGIMEGYNDTLIPPLSYFSPFPETSNTENGSNSRKRQKNKASWAENLLKERKRRAQMSDNFSVLQSMVPTLYNTFKPPKEKIIEDTINYIKYLEKEKERLEGLKKFHLKEAKMAKNVLFKCTNQSSSVKVKVSNGATFLEIQLPFRRRGSVAEIVEVLQKHRAEVLEARICVNDQRLLTFTATIMLHGAEVSVLLNATNLDILESQ